MNPMVELEKCQSWSEVWTFLAKYLIWKPYLLPLGMVLSWIIAMESVSIFKSITLYSNGQAPVELAPHIFTLVPSFVIFWALVEEVIFRSIPAVINITIDNLAGKEISFLFVGVASSLIFGFAHDYPLVGKISAAMDGFIYYYFFYRVVRNRGWKYYFLALAITTSYHAGHNLYLIFLDNTFIAPS